MHVKTEEDLLKYVIKEITGKRNENIFFSAEGFVDLANLYNKIVDKEPKLFLSIRSLRLKCVSAVPKRRYCISVFYTKVYPQMVTVAHSQDDVKKALLPATSAHRRQEYFVCKQSDLTKILAALDSSVHLPEYINNYLYCVGKCVKRRPGNSYCGVEASLEYSCDYKTAKLREQQIQSKIDEIVSIATQSGIEDWRKAITVVEYCVKHWKYKKNIGEGLEYTSYGALLKNKAVCMGFALAICEIFKRLGIPCKYICGTRNGEGHAWNMIYINGGWFYIDVTDSVSRRDPFYHWGVTEFDDGRIVDTLHRQKLICNCQKNFIEKNR